MTKAFVDFIDGHDIIADVILVENGMYFHVIHIIEIQAAEVTGRTAMPMCNAKGVWYIK